MIGPLAQQLGPLGYSRRRPAAFTFASIAGLDLWLKADSLYQDPGGSVPATADGAPVRSARDKAGGSLLAVASSASFTRIANGPGGQPAVSMDGSGQFTVTGLNLPSSRSFTLLIAHRPFRVHRNPLGFAEVGSGSSQYFFSPGSGVACQNNSPGLTPAASMSPESQVLGIVSGSVGLTIRLDGAAVGSTGATLADAMQPNLDLFGFADNGAYPFIGTWSEVLLYSRALTGPELAQAESYLRGLYPPEFPPLDKVLLLADGNSIAAGYSSTPGNDYLTRALATLGAGYVGVNRANPGYSTPLQTAAAPFDVDPYFDAGRAKNICTFWEITNDIASGGADGPTAYANVKAYGAARKAAGFTQVILDCLPRTLFGGTQETARTTCNASLAADFTVPTANPRVWLRAGGTTYADILVRVSQIPALSDATDTTYYADGTHLTDAGHALIASDVAFAVSLL